MAMKCQNCGAEVESGALFCRECGIKIQRANSFCRECGAPLPDNVKFCPQCGAKVAFSQSNSESHTVDSESKPNKNIESQNNAKNPKITFENSRFGRQKTKWSRFFERYLIVFSVIIAVVVIGVLAVAFAVLGRNLFSKKSAEKSVPQNTVTTNNVFDVISPEVSETATIEPGVEYAYMSDAWNVYIAKAVSDNIIKVESWHKSSQSDKNLKYKGDLGSFRIRDEENGFSWIDEDHTAFTLTIQDKSNSDVKKPTSVIFTII